MFQDLTSLVLDIGSYQSRIGYGGDESPKIVVPSYVASPASMDSSQKKIFVGKKNLSMDKTDLQIQSIFRFQGEQEKPRISDQNFTNFIQAIFDDELKVNLKEYSLLFSEDINFNQSQILAQRQVISKIAFEKLGVANIFFLKTPVLSCFATGRSTALVVDSGETETRVTTVHDGFVLNKTAKIVPYAGKTLNSVLEKIIQNKTEKQLQTRFNTSGSKYTESFLNFHKKDLLHDIKQYFSVGANEQVSQPSEKISYELPDKSTIVIDRSEIPDIFVSPSEQTLREMNKNQYRGIPNMITDTINSCDIDIKKQLYSNILLTGGNMLFNGQNFVNNILNRLNNIAPPNARVKPVSVCQHSERKYLSWIGGSIVTSLSAFQSYWIGREEYESVGFSILQKKCN